MVHVIEPGTTVFYTETVSLKHPFQIARGVTDLKPRYELEGRKVSSRLNNFKEINKEEYELFIELNGGDVLS